MFFCFFSDWFSSDQAVFSRNLRTNFVEFHQWWYKWWLSQALTCNCWEKLNIFYFYSCSYKYLEFQCFCKRNKSDDMIYVLKRYLQEHFEIFSRGILFWELSILTFIYQFTIPIAYRITRWIFFAILLPYQSDMVPPKFLNFKFRIALHLWWGISFPIWYSCIVSH